LGNTCFLSALLQGLAALRLPALEGGAERGDPLTRLLHQVLLELQLPGDAPLHCGALWACLVDRHPQFGHNLQQDLFEGWQIIARTRPMAELFATRRRWRTSCFAGGTGCGFLVEKADCSNVWPVPLITDASGGVCGAEHLLQRELELSQALPEWRCPCCGGLGGRQRLVARGNPHCILLQILRFEAGPGGPRKLHLPFPVPLEGLRVATLQDGAADQVACYRLLAVLLHEGELAGGHYQALALRQGGWFCMDDSRSSLSEGFPKGVEPLVYGLLFQRGG
jgi:hypothetical protein